MVFKFCSGFCSGRAWRKQTSFVQGLLRTCRRHSYLAFLLNLGRRLCSLSGPVLCSAQWRFRPMISSGPLTQVLSCVHCLSVVYLCPWRVQSKVSSWFPKRLGRETARYLSGCCRRVPHLSKQALHTSSNAALRAAVSGCRAPLRSWCKTRCIGGLPPLTNHALRDLRSTVSSFIPKATVSHRVRHADRQKKCALAPVLPSSPLSRQTTPGGTRSRNGSIPCACERPARPGTRTAELDAGHNCNAKPWFYDVCASKSRKESVGVRSGLSKYQCQGFSNRGITVCNSSTRG